MPGLRWRMRPFIQPLSQSRLWMRFQPMLLQRQPPKVCRTFSKTAIRVSHWSCSIKPPLSVSQFVDLLQSPLQNFSQEIFLASLKKTRYRFSSGCAPDGMMLTRASCPLTN